MVLFYGTFLRLHGIDIVIRAAKFLEAATDIRFASSARGWSMVASDAWSLKWTFETWSFVPRTHCAGLANEIAEATIRSAGTSQRLTSKTRVIAGKDLPILSHG